MKYLFDNKLENPLKNVVLKVVLTNSKTGLVRIEFL